MAPSPAPIPLLPPSPDSDPSTTTSTDTATCQCCRHPAPRSRTVVTAEGSTVCHTCLRAWYWMCPGCCQWNRDATACRNGCHPANCRCTACPVDTDDDAYDDDGVGCDCGDGCDGLVHDYGYKPWPVFHGDGPTFFGPEIEVAAPDHRWRSCAQLAQSRLGALGYLKQDSSIASGFEIVTHPMAYDWAIAHFPWTLLDHLRQAGCQATSDTGIHIHVSRAGFGSAGHVYRWIMFIHRNRAQVIALAGRSSPQWAAFTADDRRAAKDHAKGAHGPNRFRAINTCNHDTFELRIFAGSLDADRVQAALAFTAATVEYTRGLTIADITGRSGWTWARFAAWTATQPGYRPLTRRLRALGHLTDPGHLGDSGLRDGVGGPIQHTSMGGQPCAYSPSSPTA